VGVEGKAKQRSISMAYSEDAILLKTPLIKELPRISDRIPFLLIDRARIEQNRTGIEAFQEDETTQNILKIPIPVANLAVLLLGPGCSITTPAATTLFRHGVVIIYSSADGMTGYSLARSMTGSSKWATAQARLVTNNKARINAAKLLYTKRFPDDDLPPNLTLDKLRGLEGSIVKALYKNLAKQNGLTHFSRKTQNAEDPINIALNVANTILYGVALSVCSTLAINPALGIIHNGNHASFLYDLADMFKQTTSIPAAFSVSESEDPVKEVAREVRKRMKSQLTLEKMLDLTKELLSPYLVNEEEDKLLNDKGFVDGMRNWGLQ
jgi:CRISPR-associated protein Cas1